MTRLRIATAVAVLGLVVIGAALAAPNDGGPIGDKGAFNALCQFSHRAPDDPIVFPGQPGASHSHDFFGNESTDASSTNESLVASPGTTCVRTGEDGFEGKPGVPRAARSGYWVPTLYEDGVAVTPTRILANYEGRLRRFADIRPFPAGLRVVFGTSTGASPYSGRWGQTIYQYACQSGGPSTPGTPTTPPVCNQPTLYLQIRAPDCWDGLHLDSTNHKSHMAYSSRNQLGPDGYYVCPPSHPVLVPSLSLKVFYPTRGAGKVTLASGDTSTAHADFMNGWDQATLEHLVAVCLDRNIYCGFGDKSTGG